MNIYKIYSNHIAQIIDSLSQEGALPAGLDVSRVTAEPPRDAAHGDIATNARWANGKWTVEIARKLVTGSKFDVNFNDLTKAYGFGIAFFDNAQVRHAYIQEPLLLKFKP